MAEVITISDAMRSGRIAHAGKDVAGQILLFTGVRIERFSDTKEPARKSPDGNPPSRPPSRSKARKGKSSPG